MVSSCLNAAGTIGRMMVNERIEAGRRERRVLARVSRAAWRLEGPTGTDVGAGLGSRGGDLDPHPGRGGRAVTLAGAPARGRCRPGLRYGRLAIRLLAGFQFVVPGVCLPPPAR